MWSKGAVVIVKHGDEAIADAVEKGLDIHFREPDIDLNKLNKDSLAAEMRRREIPGKILEAQELYGYNKVPPKWARKIVSGFALIVYGFSMFVDKFLRIKEP